MMKALPSKKNALVLMGPRHIIINIIVTRAGERDSSVVRAPDS